VIAPAKPTIVTLSVQQAATELNLDELGVHRLIARRRIAATRVGNAWRILPAAVEKHVAAGAPDQPGPPVEGRWLAPYPRPFHPRGSFQDAMAAAAEEQLVADSAALARVAEADHEPVEVPVTIAGPVLETARQALPTFAQTPEIRELRLQFPTWGHLWAAQQMREFARLHLEQTPSMTPPIQRLYASPEQYAEVVKAASERLSAATFSRTHWVPLEMDGRETKRPVRFVFRADAIMTAVGVTAQQVAALAF